MPRWSIHLPICLCTTRQIGARLLLALAALFIQSSVSATEIVVGQEAPVQIEAEEAITPSTPIRRRSRSRKPQRASESVQSIANHSALRCRIHQRRLDIAKGIQRSLSGGDHSRRNGLGSPLLI